MIFAVDLSHRVHFRSASMDLFNGFLPFFDTCGQTIQIHESGNRHKGEERKMLIEKRKDRENKEREQREMNKELRAISMVTSVDCVYRGFTLFSLSNGIHGI